jgi:hypothetical protein
MLQPEDHLPSWFLAAWKPRTTFGELLFEPRCQSRG